MIRVVKQLCINSPSKIEGGGAYRLILRGFDVHNHIRNLNYLYFFTNQHHRGSVHCPLVVLC